MYERAVLQDELECFLPGEGIDADKKKAVPAVCGTARDGGFVFLRSIVRGSMAAGSCY